MPVPRPAVTTHIDAFRKRAAGLSGAELEAEITKLVSQLVEMNLMFVRQHNRKQAREKLYAVMSDDPTLQRMFAELRAAAKRET